MITIYRINDYIRKQPPARLIAAGFATVIILGTLLLMLPVSQSGDTGITFIDSLFTATSAVCVTGLVTVDPGSTFSLFGKLVIMILIQIGGLGVATVGVMLIAAARRMLGIREMSMIRESFNISGYKELNSLFIRILKLTFLIESVGAASVFFILVRQYSPLKALGYAVFHSVSAFNNAGFDVFGRGDSLAAYHSDIPFNIITMLLIVLGGIGFPVMTDIFAKKRFKKLSLHSKAVICTTAVLIAAGAVLLRLTENITWLGAVFQSISTRTAGFSTYNLGEFSSAGLFICIILMVIGASPGSTGGGIKTTTVFVVCCSIRASMLNRNCNAFRRRIPDATIKKAFSLLVLAASVVCAVTLLLSAIEPQFTFIQCFFEAASAYSTAGLSTGITGALSHSGKIIIIITMYLGRIGVLTAVTLWGFKSPASVSYIEENIAIG